MFTILFLLAYSSGVIIPEKMVVSFGIMMLGMIFWDTIIVGSWYFFGKDNIDNESDTHYD